jgi:hypothetical protein
MIQSSITAMYFHASFKTIGPPVAGKRPGVAVGKAKVANQW